MKTWKRHTNFLFVISGFFLISCAAPPRFPEGEVIDLSYAYDQDTIYWPTEEGFLLEKEFEGFTEKGYYYFSNKFRTAEHGGTHIDAPRHFAERGKTVDEIPLDQLMGPGVLVDVSSSCEKNRDHQIQVEDFLTWEKKNGRIPQRSIVLLETGFGKYWPHRVPYMGTDERGQEAVQKLHFPGLHPEAARWLVEERQIKALGIDTPSVDYGQSKFFESHATLFEKDIPALENLANLDKLPAKNFYVIALPMKIKRGSGGPTRVVAIL